MAGSQEGAPFAGPGDDSYRRRLMAGAAEALAEHGYSRLTVEQVVAAAGVSRATFYAHFDDLCDCLRAAHRAAFERLLAEIAHACAGEREWPHKVRAAIGAVIEFAEAEPARVHLLTLTALATEPAILSQITEYNEHLTGLLRRGRRRLSQVPELPDSTEEALVGGMSRILAWRLDQAQGEGLGELRVELVQIVLTPYLGGEQAALVAAPADR